MRLLLLGAFLLAAAAPASAQRAAVLLGLGQDSTLWIATSADTLIVRRGPGIFVPRRDGFWQVRWVGATCPPKIVPQPVGGGSRGAVALTAAPLGRHAVLPTIEHPTVCDPAYNTDSDENVHYEAALRFIGTDHLVMEYHYVNEGESAQTRLFVNAAVVLALDDVGRRGFGLEDWSWESAPPLDREEQEALLADCLDSLASEGSRTPVLTIRRGMGRWVYDGAAYSDCSMCNNEVDVCRIDARPPREVVGFDSLTVAWSAIAHRVPRAIDAFTSPRGDFAVVRDSAGLQVFRAAGGALADRRGAIPLTIEADIVLAQWALGASVRRWDAILTPRLGASRPPR
jgi:hypothetical protein